MDPPREKTKDTGKKHSCAQACLYHSLYGQLRAYCYWNLHGSGFDQEDTFEYFSIFKEEETDFFHISKKRNVMFEVVRDAI